MAAGHWWGTLEYLVNSPLYGTLLRYGTLVDFGGSKLSLNHVLSIFEGARGWGGGAYVRGSSTKLTALLALLCVTGIGVSRIPLQ